MRGPSRPRRAAVALVASVILVASAIPIPGTVPAEDGSIPPSVLFHFLGYATLAAVIGIASLRRTDRVRTAVIALSGSNAYGASIECLQYPIPYRSFSYFDMIVNVAGAILGTTVLLGVLALSDDHR